jgi:hypothetical protein
MNNKNINVKAVIPGYMNSLYKYLHTNLNSKATVNMHLPSALEVNLSKDIFICAGYSQHNNTNIIMLPSNYLAAFLRMKYSPGKKIFFINNLEGGIDDVIDRIYSALELTTNIPYSDVYYITGAVNPLEGYDRFCRINDIKNNQRINVAGVSMWEEYMLQSIHGCVPKFEVRVKDKLFLCFNRVNRAHRTLLVAKCIEAGIIEKSYFSFFLGANHYPGIHNEHLTDEQQIENELNNLLSSVKSHISDHTELYHEIKDAIKKNKHIFPLKLNIDPDQNKTWLDSNDTPLYENSYLSIVTETSFFDRKFQPASGNRTLMDWYSVFFTEKIFKPIAMKHPFIVLGRPNFLMHLKKRGYKTFSPFINEDYDSIEDSVKRFEAIMTEINRLSKFNDQEWLDWLSGVKDIVEHNHATLQIEKNSITEKNF